MRRYKLYKICLTVSRFLQKLIDYSFIWVIAFLLLMVTGMFILGLGLLMIFIYLALIMGFIGLPMALFGMVYGHRHSPGGLNKADAQTFKRVAIIYSIPVALFLCAQIINSHVIEHVRYSINNGPSSVQLAKVKLGTLQQVKVLLEDCKVDSVEVDRYDSWGLNEPKNLYISVAMRNHFGAEDDEPAPPAINLPYADFERLKIAVEQKNSDLESGEYPSCWRAIELRGL